MAEKSGGKQVITSKLDLEINLALRALADRYKEERGIKGRVSISDAVRFFLREHEPEVLDNAAKAAQQQSKIAKRRNIAE